MRTKKPHPKDKAFAKATSKIKLSETQKKKLARSNKSLLTRNS